MINQLLLHYRIIKKLGQGGMGEVYLAQDIKLDRPVALKMLPPNLRHDPKRLARFHTEAKAAAKLNHPNIATIYAVDEVNDLLFITMEFVDGQPLTHLLPTTGLPLDQFFTWFLPLSDALCHAHERGVRHRDLKPGNIMILNEGAPKILDFGLAQITRPEPEEGSELDSEDETKSVDPARLPPLLKPGPRSLTEQGEVMGTPSYMSPQQAEGKKTDHRTDIFSLGVVMYEALAGRRPFVGESVEAIIGRILTAEPEPVTAVRSELPRDMGKLVRNCLQKDLKRRIQSMVDVRRELEDAKRDVDAGTVVIETRAGARETRVSAVLRRWPVLIGAAVILLVIGVLAAYFTLTRVIPSPEPPLRKFQLPVEGTLSSDPAISPDGTMVAYIQGGRLWIRHLDRMESQEIPDSEGARFPFWSPRSDFVGYAVPGTFSIFKKVSVQGGPSTTVCRFSLFSGQSDRSAAWSPEGTIIMALRSLSQFSLFAVSAQGGEPRLFLQPDSTHGETLFSSPHFLPDGRTLVFRVRKQDDSWDLVVQVGESRRSLVHVPPGEVLDRPIYSPTGHLVYSRNVSDRTDLWAVPFNLSSLTVTGESFLVAQNAAWPSVSSGGTLVYRSATATATQQLVWVDRSGKVGETIGQPQNRILHPALSPDGRRVAVWGTEQDNEDIWIHDVDRGIKTRLTVDPAGDGQPAWSPDGKKLAFFSGRGGQIDIYIQPADGSRAAQPLVTGPLTDAAPIWSRDGRYVAYYVISPTNRDLWYLPLTGVRKPVPFMQTPFEELRPVISPDGRFIAYMSNESGRYEVYVKLFPTGEGKWLVSVNGGVHPEWSGRGNELFYVEGNTLMAVPVDTKAGFWVGSPRPLFTGDQVGTRLYDSGLPGTPLYTVSADGQRFVVVQQMRAGTTTTIAVVQNWAAEFKKAVTSDK